MLRRPLRPRNTDQPWALRQRGYRDRPATRVWKRPRPTRRPARERAQTPRRRDPLSRIVAFAADHNQPFTSRPSDLAPRAHARSFTAPRMAAATHHHRAGQSACRSTLATPRDRRVHPPPRARLARLPVPMRAGDNHPAMRLRPSRRDTSGVGPVGVEHTTALLVRIDTISGHARRRT